MANLNYIRSGKGAKKILFIHGNVASANWWRPVMDELADSFDMLAVDLRGYGKSPAGSQEVTFSMHAKDILTLLCEMEFFPCTVVGHSLGGAVAMQLSQDAPAIIAAMILVDSAPIGGMTPFDPALLEPVVANEELLKNALLGTFVQPVDADLLEEFKADCLLAKDAFIPNSVALTKVDYTASAKKFMKPVLLIHGEQDHVVPLEESKRAAASYPHSRLEIIAGSGHNPQIERMDVFSRLVKQFEETL